MNRGQIGNRLFNAIAALSLALFIFSPIAWLRSEDQDEGIGRDRSWVDGSTLYAMEDSIEWGDGLLMVEHHGRIEPNITPITPGRWVTGTYVRPTWIWFADRPDFIQRVRVPKAGIGDFVDFYLITLGAPATDYALAIPLWLVTAISAILPAIWLARWVHERDRKQIGHCKQCGYDLRASRDYCPECGAAIPRQEPSYV